MEQTEALVDGAAALGTSSEVPESGAELATMEASTDYGRARMRALLGDVDVGLALELDGALNRSLTTFEREHEQLLRLSCQVPAEHTDIRDVVWTTFLGHVLARLEAKKGRLQMERVVANLLESFELARQHSSALMASRAAAQVDAEKEAES